jgi:O-antigen chain-terminating methyltransferase
MILPKMDPELAFLDEIAAEVRLLRRSDASSSANAAHTDVPGDVPELVLSDSQSLVAGIQSGTELVGNAPPDPGTLRSAIGRHLVSIVRRMLFWYTPAIQGFQRRVASALAEHNTALRQLNERQARSVESNRRDMQVHATTAASRLDALVAAHQQALSSLTEQQQTRLAAFEEQLHGQAQAITAIRDSLELLSSALGQAKSQIGELSTLFAAARADQNANAQRLVSVEEATRVTENSLSPAVAEIRLRIAGLEQQLNAADEQIRAVDRFTHGTRAETVALGRRVSLVLQELRRGTAEEAPVAAVPDAMPDQTYVDFEHIYRGTEQDIKDRCAPYLLRLSESGLKSPEMPVLDIGCGRGEWLDLLRENGFIASGIDTNSSMIEVCRAKHLTVEHSDAITHLGKLRDSSIGVVTAIHVVEHLPFGKLMTFIDEVVRVLKPGGLAIFETPNPENLRVGACTFYMDPTHQKPLPSGLLQFLVESRGLCSVEVLPLHPYPDSFRLKENTTVAHILNALIFSEQDYAVIGLKV